MGIKAIERLKAIGESGKVYDVIKFQQLPTGHIDTINTGRRIRTVRSFFWQLEDGREVQQIEGEAVFMIKATGEKLRRV